MSKVSLCSIDIKTDKEFESRLDVPMIQLADSLIEEYNNTESFEDVFVMTPFISSYKEKFDAATKLIADKGLQSATDLNELALELHNSNPGELSNHPIISYCITCCPIYNEAILYLYEQNFVLKEHQMLNECDYVDSQLALVYMLLRVYSPGIANEFFIAVKREMIRAYTNSMKNIDEIDDNTEPVNIVNTFEENMKTLLNELN